MILIYSSRNLTELLVCEIFSAVLDSKRVIELGLNKYQESSK